MWNDFNVLSLSVYILPCASRLVDQDGLAHGGGEDCIWDQQEVEQYLGSYNMLMYRNIAEFKQDKYGEDSVQKKSVLSSRYSIANKNPSFTQTNVVKTQLIDEVEMIQLGQQTIYEF